MYLRQEWLKAKLCSEVIRTILKTAPFLLKTFIHGNFLEVTDELAVGTDKILNLRNYMNRQPEEALSTLGLGIKLFLSTQDESIDSVKKLASFLKYVADFSYVIAEKSNDEDAAASLGRIEMRATSLEKWARSISPEGQFLIDKILQNANFFKGFLASYASHSNAQVQKLEGQNGQKLIWLQAPAPVNNLT